eukprot:1887322-Rhodomonas_salina.1
MSEPLTAFNGVLLSCAQDTSFLGQRSCWTRPQGVCQVSDAHRELRQLLPALANVRSVQT